jgi:citrate lyase subunit beta/citryl-CoA lyase
VAIVTETARGVQLLPEFRDTLPRLRALMWGAEDLCASLGGNTNRGPDGRYLSPYIAARDGCLFAARSLGVIAIDAVYTAFRDSAGLERECKDHGALGFDAKAAIHPAQLPVIEQALRPSAEQINWAEKVIRSFEESPGAAAMDGSMIDAPHLQRARNILRASS